MIEEKCNTAIAVGTSVELSTTFPPQIAEISLSLPFELSSQTEKR
jgi:hypothetical protein